LPFAATVTVIVVPVCSCTAGLWSWTTPKSGLSGGSLATGELSVHVKQQLVIELVQHFSKNFFISPF
jgi:hypothetical protein